MTFLQLIKECRHYYIKRIMIIDKYKPITNVTECIHRMLSINIFWIVEIKR